MVSVVPLGSIRIECSLRNVKFTCEFGASRLRRMSLIVGASLGRGEIVVSVVGVGLIVVGSVYSR